MTYTSDFPDLFADQAVTATFRASPRPHGEIGGGRERPPLFAARCGRGGAAQLTFAPHPLGGVAPVQIIPGGKAKNDTRDGQDVAPGPDGAASTNNGWRPSGSRRWRSSAPAALTTVRTAAIGASRETVPAAVKPARLRRGHRHELRGHRCRIPEVPGRVRNVARAADVSAMVCSGYCPADGFPTCGFVSCRINSAGSGSPAGDHSW